MPTSAASAFNPDIRTETRPARLRLVPLGLSLGATLATFFSLCVALGALFPDFGLHKPWLQFYPGFEWLTWRGFFIGLVEAYAYGWFAALVFVPFHNFFSARFG